MTYDWPLPKIVGLTAVIVWAVAVALTPSTTGRLALLGTGLAVGLFWWLSCGADRWLTAFFATAILLPPLPFALGNSGPHIAPLFAAAGILVFLLSIDRARLRGGRLLLFLLLFMGALLESIIFAALLSGPDVALLSLFRILLVAIAPFILLYVLTRQTISVRRSIGGARLLFRFAVAAAAFACADFYFQFPSPVGYSAQFVWLENTVLRRAQGLFYEASTLGNFCAFFLVLMLIAFFSRREIRFCSRIELGLGGSILAAALIFSYSRGSLLNLLCAACAFFCLRRFSGKRFVLVTIGGAIVIAALVYVLFPSFSESYWLRLGISVRYLPSEPGAVLSGRLSSWITLAQFLIQNPSRLLFGIGYKTLPYSSYVGAAVIADNTYLDLLVETGLLGLCSFLALNVEMLRRSFRAARSPDVLPKFFGTWFFCFWIGELVQMVSGDLITYWRVLPIFFWTLGVAIISSSENSITN